MTTHRDSAAFAAFVQARSASLFRTAYLVLGDYGLAQDLLQESLTKTYVAWGRLREPQNAEAYTRRVLVTTAASWRRRKSFAERPTDVIPERPGGDVAEAVVSHEAVWTALGSLPVRQRTALVLRYYEDLSDAQIADVMGCVPGTVRSQVSQGLRRLRGQVGMDVAGVPHSEQVT